MHRCGGPARAAAAGRAGDVDQRVIDYAVRIVRATRGSLGLAAGSGPRGAIALVRAARAAAIVEGRGFATPDDVKRCCLAVLRHRVTLAPDARLGVRWTSCSALLQSVVAPRLIRACAFAAAEPEACSSPSGWPCSPRWPACSARRPSGSIRPLPWSPRSASSISPRMRLDPARLVALAAPCGSASCRRPCRSASNGARRQPGQRGPSRRSGRLFEHVDATVEVRDLPATVQVPPETAVRIPYRARAMRRGTIRIAPAELRLASRGGGWELRKRLGGEAVLRVYPNFAAVSRYAWLAGDRRLAEIGIKSYPQRGHGTAFKQLADYRPGDPIRDVDWKSSMRHGRPIVREYEDERDQRIVFMLDCRPAHARRRRPRLGPARPLRRRPRRPDADGLGRAEGGRCGRRGYLGGGATRRARWRRARDWAR